MSRSAISPVAFPLTAKYDPQWIRDNALGENALCQVESLARRLPLRAGMRVLDLGCGKATSSIFLAREFGIEAWAADAATSPTENRKRAVALECERSVFPASNFWTLRQRTGPARSNSSMHMRHCDVLRGRAA